MRILHGSSQAVREIAVFAISVPKASAEGFTVQSGLLCLYFWEETGYNKIETEGRKRWKLQDCRSHAA